MRNIVQTGTWKNFDAGAETGLPPRCSLIPYERACRRSIVPQERITSDGSIQWGSLLCAVVGQYGLAWFFLISMIRADRPCASESIAVCTDGTFPRVDEERHSSCELSQPTADVHALSLIVGRQGADKEEGGWIVL